MKQVATIVFALAKPVVEGLGLELWDVEYVREGGRRILRVYIDRDGGVSTEHCEAVSRALDPLLDEADPIEEAYVLEVSSCGLERPLKRPQDFERFIGSPVVVKFYAAQKGQRETSGVLTAYDGETLTLDGERVISMRDIALTHLKFEWNG